MKNTKMKFKLRVKITGRVKALIASMLSPVLIDFASIRQTSPNSMRLSTPCFVGTATRLDAMSTSQTFQALDSTPMRSWNLLSGKADGLLGVGQLQELLAPISVEFFSRERKRLSNKRSLKQQIHEITGIADSALQGAPLSHFSIKERLSWIEPRETKLEEDKAYSMLGIFDVSMSLRYSEGRMKAFKRLLKKIEKPTNEHMEPASKRRKIDSHSAGVDHSLPQPAKKDLLDFLRFDQINDRFINIKPGHSKTCR